MLFKTILFGGFLFATVCGSGKPRIATLEVLPNYDQGLTHKDFRVHYSGAGDSFAGSSATIKIYKKDQSTSPFHTFEVGQDQVNIPKAYYFGYTDATAGDYEVDVCVGSNCSGKNQALTSIKADHYSKKVICEKGSEEDKGGVKTWKKKVDVELDVLGAEKWLESSDISDIDRIAPTEWTKKQIKSNPSYEKSKHQLYAAVLFDIGYYRDLFMKKEAKGADQTLYAPDFCKRKYILSYHVHVLEKDTYEVIHRVKRTLHMSKEGKTYFIYDNTNSAKEQRRKVHVELTSIGDLGLKSDKNYQVWVSFCATEKDENESTVCSDPFIKDLDISE